MRRTRPKATLRSSPLILVLCQVRFSRLEAMSKYVPEIQDVIRRKGYPLNESKLVQEIQLTPSGPAAREQMRWEFLSKDQTSSVVLHEEFLVLQTTGYDDFETFLAQLEELIEILNASVGGLFVTRVGLRYVNVIIPQQAETWRDYVQQGLHGFDSSIFKEQRTFRLHQTTAETNAGTMVVRLHQNPQGNVLPPDLMGGTLKAPIRFARPGELVTLVDIDHFHTCSADEYKRERLEEIGWQLKNGSYEVFADQIATPHALEVWR